MKILKSVLFLACAVFLLSSFNTKNVPQTTAKQVLNNYLEAIGGKDNVLQINTLQSTASASSNGVNLLLQTKLMAPNKNAVKMSVNGTVLSNRVFNGVTGYTIVNGEKKEMSKDELYEARRTSTPFMELNILNTSKYMGIEKWNSKDIHVIAVNNKLTLYYDVRSGLKVKAKILKDINNQKVTQVIEYSNYKKVGNLLFPHTSIISAGSQKTTFKTLSIILNKGVSKNDFN